ncbi:hypothetical protein RZS08_28640, partial [Arthrospira platensis SPKY1]|nr:hypothetical protein [Arthrospira platensis SPKY1]
LITKTPQVIHAQHMVGVAMCQNEGIDLRNVIMDALQAQLRRGIDLNCVPPHDNMDRATGAPIARVCQITAALGMRDHGNSLRSASA